MDEILIKNIEKIRNGFDYWQKMIDKNYVNESTHVVLFPSHVNEYNIAGIKYIDDYFNKKKAKHRLVITCDKFVYDTLSSWKSSNIIVHLTSDENCCNLVKWCDLCRLYERFAIIDLDNISNVNQKMRKFMDYSTDEMIKYGIYKIVDD